MSIQSEGLYFIAVPEEDKPNGGYDDIEKCISSSVNSFCDIHRFEIPKLPVGTLEILMVLSEELIKVDTQGRGVLDKIRKAYYELVQEGSRNSLLVANGTILDYLKSFVWNETSFSKTDKLQELSKKISDKFANEETEIRKMNNRYTEIKNQLVALKRKSGTTLLSAPISSILTNDVILQGTGGMTPSELFINTDFMKTIVIVISKTQEKEFLASYEKLYSITNNSNGTVMYGTIPKSARRIIEDKDSYVLYTIVILKKFENEINEICKEHHYHIREYDISEETDKPEMKDEEKIAKLENEEKNMKSSITRWCRPHFSDIYQAWVHLKVIRVYIEAILRYGLPPKFISAIIKVRPKMEKRLEKSLISKYEHLGGKIKAYEKDSNNTIIGGSDTTNYPFVCINIERLA